MWIELAHSYEVPANVMVNCHHKADRFADRAVWRGDALIRWWEGSDGVYMFNVFDPTLWLWWELGDPEQLKGLDHSYLWDYLPSQRNTSDVLAEVRLTRFRWPVTVTAEGCEAMPLFVGEDLSAPAPAGKQRELTLRVHVTGLTATHQLTVQVNGQALPEPQVSPALTDQPQNVWLEYDVTGDLFQAGENAVEARLATEQAISSPVNINQIRLNVDYQPD